MDEKSIGRADSHAGPKDGARRVRVPVAVLLAVVCVLSGGIVWRLGVHNQQVAFEAAKASCLRVADGLRVRENGYRAVVDGTAARVRDVKADGVADAGTVAALQRELKVVPPAVSVYCTADAKAGLDAAAYRLHVLSGWYAAHARRLAKAADAVARSQAAKQLADARTALKDSLDAARVKLAESDGKVQDNATRDNLQKAIDAASKDVKDAKAANDLKAQLDNAVNTVNASEKAKSEADAQVAAKTANGNAQGRVSGANGVGSPSGGASQTGGDYNYEQQQQDHIAAVLQHYHVSTWAEAAAIVQQHWQQWYYDCFDYHDTPDGYGNWTKKNPWPPVCDNTTSGPYDQWGMIVH